METLHYPITHHLSSCLIPQDPCNVWILRLRFAARKMTGGVVQRILKNFAKKFLFKGAGGIIGLMDFGMLVKAWREGKYFDMSPWLASGFASFLSVTTYFAAGWPALILFLIGVAIIAAIVIFTDDDFQEWLSRCRFGKGKGERYRDMKHEMLAFEEASK